MGAHILYGAAKPSVFTSDEEFYPAAAQFGAFANKQARRSDITAVVGAAKEIGHGAPACFVPSLGEMHINTSIVPLGRVDRIDINDRLWKLEHAPVVGAVAHDRVELGAVVAERPLLLGELDQLRMLADAGYAVVGEEVEHDPAALAV